MINPNWKTWSTPMTELVNEENSAAEPLVKTLATGAIRLASLLSTMFLVGCSSLYLYLSIGFTAYSSPDFALWKAASIAMDAVPLCVFAAVGFAGLKLWPRGRFRLWGLSAIVFQIAMAIWVLANPEKFIFLSPNALL